MDYNKSNLEKAVDLSLNKWVESIENEMQLTGKTAFLCGNIEQDFFYHFDITEFINNIRRIIEDNNIKKIYHCKRTYFDVKFCDLVRFLKFDIEIVQLCDIYKDDKEYRTRQNKGAYKILCPFEKEIENEKLYQTLYDFAIENSDCLIAYSKFDDDISNQIIKKAAEKGKAVFNIADLI